MLDINEWACFTTVKYRNILRSFLIDDFGYGTL